MEQNGEGIKIDRVSHKRENAIMKKEIEITEDAVPLTEFINASVTLFLGGR